MRGLIVYLIVDNLALGKTATQSSDYYNNPSAYPASNAVNGKLDDFTHTLTDTTNQWWMVDLEKPYNVTTIELYNRQNPMLCEYEKLQNSQDSIFNDKFSLFL